MKNNKRIYLDYSATTPVREEVINVILPCLSLDFGNPSSIYETGRRAKNILEDSRNKIANSLNVTSSEIFFVSGGSESDNWAIKGIAKAYKDKGNHIITSKIEHHAVLHTCEALEKEGYEVTYIDVDDKGIINLDQLKAAIKSNTILVSIMAANNEIGTIQPINEISLICKDKKILFHSDAVQLLGTTQIDLKTFGPDLVSFSAHKIFGPKGIGMLYVRKGIKISPLIDGGAQERRKRAGTENVPFIVGFAEALCLAQKEALHNSAYITNLREYLIENILTKIKHVRLNGDRIKRLPGNANFSFEFVEGESLLLLLDYAGFECSSGSACTSGSLDPSHVLLAIGLPHEIAHGSLRISIGKHTLKEDLDLLVEELGRIIDRLRKMSPLYEDYLNGKLTEPHCMLTGDSSYCKLNVDCEEQN